MSTALSFDAPTLLAIVAMALATAFTRLAGYFLVGLLKVEGRLKAALDALPPAILVAVIAPTVLTTGPAESGAALVTVAATWLRLPLLAVIVAGVLAVVGLRLVLAA